MHTKTITAGLALAIAVPAAAGAKKPEDKPAKSDTKTKTVGYNARGTYVSSELSQTAGADTKKRSDDRYSGSLVVDVRKANRKAAATGEQTFELTDARVKFHPRKDTEAAAGDRVVLHGKFDKRDATVTVRRVDIKAKRS